MKYREQQRVKHFCGMLDGLAFLPLDDIKQGLDYLRQVIPTGEGLDDMTTLVDYFDATYVTGSVRRVNRQANGHQETAPLRVRRVPALFEATLWNVHEATLLGNDRTNNQCESWNRGFGSLVGHSHPGLWVTIEALQQDAALASNVLVLNARGQPPTKRVKRGTTAAQKRLQAICQNRRDNIKTIPESLQSLGHVIRLQL